LIKIDFHIHTVATLSDPKFDFSLSYLKNYVSKAKLNAIAITNHNMFDFVQFNEIKESLGIAVFPGIEINLEDGHLLLISDGTDLDGFNQKCALVAQKISRLEDLITVTQLKEIYTNFEKYLLIPHHEKDPAISEEKILGLKEFFTAGEVSSPKKFRYCIKDDKKLVPVYFSDARMSEDGGLIPVRQTYLNCEVADFSVIKSCLRDKNKVFLSADETKELFEIFEDGQKLSLGLNVVIGERSSGKSYTLNKIEAQSMNVKYIKQFTLVERNEKDDEERFDKKLASKRSRFTDEFLSQLREVTNDVMNVDIEKNEDDLEKYLEALKKYARESERRDQFSKAKLFGEEEFSIQDQKGLFDLIASTINLIENLEFKEVVQKHISVNALKALVVELLTMASAQKIMSAKKEWLNKLIKEVKAKLQSRSAATAVPSINLYDIGMNKIKVQKFKDVVDAARKEKTIGEESFYRFKIVADAKAFSGANDIKAVVSGKKGSFVEALKVYHNPYHFLRELKKIDGVQDADIYKYFVKIEYKILNKDGFEVSGGERSEFNLLHEIQDARSFDILLIDEPESSFDNLFLNSEVNEMIREISKEMPVVVVTHNSTVGASIKPNYLLCTTKGYEEKRVKYTIYSGHPADKELVSTDGSKVDTFAVTLGCLEAGAEVYEKRRKGYEDLKN
jgi:hypothetical protein